jgi:hypothetical protein
MPATVRVLSRIPGEGVLGREGGLERRQRLAAPRQSVETGMAARRQGLGIGHADVADHASGGDLRLVEGFFCRPGLRGKGGDGAQALCAASFHPFGPAQR